MNLDAHLEALLHTPGRELSGLAVGVLRGGQSVYQGYFGHRRIDPHNPANNLPITAQTQFRVASISKISVAVAVLQLVERGKLELDRDIGDYLGYPARNPHFPQQALTLRQLLSHTSSLRDGNLGYSVALPHTLEVFFRPGSPYYAEGSHFASEPPGFFNYCNLNFGVMGTLIECASGLRFDRYMQQAVFEPLGLEAGFNVHNFSPSQLHNLAALYRKGWGGERWEPEGPWVAQVDDYQGQPPSEYRVENPDKDDPQKSFFTLDDYRIGTNGTLFSPQGGLRASLPDLLQLMRLLLGDGSLGGVRLLQPHSLEALCTPQWDFNPLQPNGDPYHGLFRSWTLGLQRFTHTADRWGGDCLVRSPAVHMLGHLGDAYGLLGGFIFDRSRRCGLVYLIGGVGSDPAQYPGQYSSFSRWEEDILSALYPLLQD